MPPPSRPNGVGASPRRAIFGTWACRLGLAWGRKRRVRAADRPGRGRGGLRRGRSVTRGRSPGCPRLGPRAHHAPITGTTRGIDRSTGLTTCRQAADGGVRHREPDRDTILDVTRPSAVPPPWADGTAVAPTLTHVWHMVSRRSFAGSLARCAVRAHAGKRCGMACRRGKSWGRPHRWSRRRWPLRYGRCARRSVRGRPLRWPALR